MIIFRIEAIDGNGPFRHVVPDLNLTLATIHDWSGTAGRMPGPWEERWSDEQRYVDLWTGRLYIGSVIKFGCVSLTQLRDWFNSREGTERMADHGAVLAAYEVPDEFLLTGSCQVLFDAGHAERLWEKPASALWENETEDRSVCNELEIWDDWEA